jgi:hypothetical protein
MLWWCQCHDNLVESGIGERFNKEGWGREKHTAVVVVEEGIEPRGVDENVLRVYNSYSPCGGAVTRLAGTVGECGVVERRDGGEGCWGFWIRLVVSVVLSAGATFHESGE